MKQPFKDRASDFFAGKGFYIVLFLCVAAIGLSGYYLLGVLQDPGQTVSGTIQVTVTPTVPEHSAAQKDAQTTPAAVKPVQPTQTTAPKPSASAAPSASPSAAPAAAEGPVAEYFVWPLQGEVLRGHSVETLSYDPTMGDWRTHEGVDLVAQAGAVVMAAGDGRVLAVFEDDLMGTTVTVDHGEGVVSVYSNLAAQPTVAEGDTVRAGDTIGSVGESAMAESALPSHLHFAMKVDGVPADPMEYLPENSQN